MGPLIGVALRIGVATAKVLPSAAKVMVAKASAITAAKVAIVTGHAVVGTVKVVGSVAIGLIAAHELFGF